MSFQDSDEIYSVDWSTFDHNSIIIAGNNCSVTEIDIRNTSKPVKREQFGNKPITKVTFSEFDRNLVLAGGAHFYVLDRSGANFEPKFVHTGHNSSIIDFDECSTNPWNFLTVSENPETNFSGGGIVQMWKPLDILLKPEMEAE